MAYRFSKSNNSTLPLRVMCAIVFWIFSALWLFCFQADLLAVAQHVLSGGLTNYHRLLSPVIIIVLLQLLQMLVYSLTRLRKRGHALTYFPSMLVLAALTDVSPDIDIHASWGYWWWLFPLLIVVWLVLVFLMRTLQDVEPKVEPVGVFSRAMWVNVSLMVLMILMVACLSNTNAVFHYRMKAEACLLENDWEGALKVGRKSLESDANLQMVRMYALARKGELGERLFLYPIVAGSSAMLPTGGEARSILYPVDSIYRYFGGRPAEKMLPMRYLKLLERRDTVVSRPLADYELCGLLIDKRLDEFVNMLCQYYQVSDAQNADRLPKHYREALTLYNHLRSKPRFVYQNAVMEEDFNNFKDLEAKYPLDTERKGKVEEQYAGTYWYYYYYV